MAFDHIRISFFNDGGESPQRRILRFFGLGGINQDQFFPAAVIGKRDARNVILRCLGQIRFSSW